MRTKREENPISRHERKIKLFAVALAVLPCLAPAAAAYSYAGTYSLSSGNATLSNQVISANSTDVSGVYVTGGASLTLNTSTVTTTSNTSNMDNSNFYGVNAAVVTNNGTINMYGGVITSSGTGANAAFASGSSAVLYLSSVTINCHLEGSRALDATNGGTITAVNVNATTRGKNSSVIATDTSAGGTVHVLGGRYTVTGQDSAGAYSTGVINISSAVITSGSEAGVIEGGNSLTFFNTALTGGIGTKNWGFLIYNSMSGDAASGTGHLTMTRGSYNWASSTGPAFYATNGTGVINLTGVAVNNSSSLLLKAAANSWGTSGSNGGHVNFTASGETLNGGLYADSISSITATLKDSTALTGYIHSAKLTIDASSEWIVTADSVLTGITNHGTITFNAPAGVLASSASYKTITASSYAGSGGTMVLNVYFNGSSSLSDMLLMNAGAASGTTTLKVNVAGSVAAVTSGNGIKLVGTANSGTTSSTAFTLYGGTICVGGTCYKLVRGSTSGSTSLANSWYLRSTDSTDTGGFSSGSAYVQAGPNGYAQPGRGYLPTIHLVNPPQSGHVTVKIYTLRNARLVKTIETDVAADTTTDIVWDCLNTDNDMIGSGIYIAVIDGAGYSDKKIKIGVLR